MDDVMCGGSPDARVALGMQEVLVWCLGSGERNNAERSVPPPH